MASIVPLNSYKPFPAAAAAPFPEIPSLNVPTSFTHQKHSSTSFTKLKTLKRTRFHTAFNQFDKNSSHTPLQDDEVGDDLGVKAALSVLRFYKSEISPLLPRSCRYVPTCSEYSMEAYEKYGFVKGTILTACRVCRCSPLGGSGFDPPRWFDEAKPPAE